jgi:hypothetical protein
MDHHVSAYDLINNFKRYEESIRKFGVDEDELFEKLSIKNKQMERFESQEKEEEKKVAGTEVHLGGAASTEEISTIAARKGDGMRGLPVEILMEIFKMLDVRTFMIRVPFVCKEWSDIIHSEKTRKQAGKLFKAHCFAIWGHS